MINIEHTLLFSETKANSGQIKKNANIYTAVL